MQKIFPRFVDGSPAWGLLVLRLVFGAGMIMHSLPKIQNPMHWMDKMHNAAPPVLQAISAGFEFGGGIALILGLITPLVALIGLINFFTAYWTQSRGAHWIGGKPSFELISLYFTVMLTLLLTGPGKISIDAILFGRKKR
jgi:putative oxidoreductase